MNIYVPSAPEATIQPVAKTITGRFLAHSRLNARDRARLAADIIDGRTALGPLTAKQVIGLCHTNAVYVAEARDPGRRNRLRRIKLEKAWEAVDPDIRAEFCRVVGVENVWRVLAAAIG
jgi:hypothetical protein